MQHKQDMAVLAAEKTTAIAEAKLKAIKQSIIDERMSVVFEETKLEDTRSHTQNWVNAQEEVNSDGHDRVNAMTVNRETPNIQTGTEQVTWPRINEMPNTSIINQATYFPQGFAGNLPIYKP